MAENNQKDYKNGRIYCIRNNITDDIYIGSTTQPLSKRMAWHRQDAKHKAKMHYMLYSKFNEIGIDNFYIELLENYPCETLEQLRKREGEFIREMATLNSLMAGRTKKEYREQNKDKRREYLEQNKDIIKEKNKEYYDTNKEKIKEQLKEYREQNKEKIKEYVKKYHKANRDKILEYKNQKMICACGGKYTVSHKSHHEKSMKHQQFIQQCNV